VRQASRGKVCFWNELGGILVEKANIYSPRVFLFARFGEPLPFTLLFALSCLAVSCLLSETAAKMRNANQITAFQQVPFQCLAVSV
jgi:hypothetical protein